MKSKFIALLSVAVAMIMVTCAVPFVTDDDTEALVGDTDGMSLNTNSAVIYEKGGVSSVELDITQTVAGDSAANATWVLNDLNDGTSFVSLSAQTGSTTTVSVTSLNGAKVASVEVTAYIGSNHASAVIVAYPSPGTSATVFHFYIQIDQDAIEKLIADGQITDKTVNTTNVPADKDVYKGFWIDVTQAETGLSDDKFNALSALEWYLDHYKWENNFSSYGWIQTLLGLGTYSISSETGTWYYWAQYHMNNDGWTFNNTTLSYIDTVEESYIGLIFWGSPNADATPDCPGYRV